jgi:hypothetical protein
VSGPSLLSRAALCCALVGAILAAPGAGAGADRGRCEPPRGYVVFKRTAKAVVLLSRTRGPVYGCSFRTDRLIRLARYSPRYPLAGRYVAYREVIPDPVGGTKYDVFVVDLRRDRVKHVHPAYTNRTADDGTVNSTITDIVLKRNGSVAWISCPTRDPNEEFCHRHVAYQVWRSDSRGAERLAHAEAVRLHSLKRRGSTISWRQGTQERRAGLR